jgi:hypothetical protein
MQFEPDLWLLHFRFIMKFLVVLSAFLAVSFAQYCYNDVVGSCGPRGIVSITKP